MELVIVVVVIALVVVVGSIVYSGYSDAKVRRDREEREAAKYGTVSASTLAARDQPVSSVRRPATEPFETKTLTLQMRERIGMTGVKPSSDAAKLEKLIADGWEIVSQVQAPHGARLTTYTLRRPR